MFSVIVAHCEKFSTGQNLCLLTDNLAFRILPKSNLVIYSKMLYDDLLFELNTYNSKIEFLHTEILSMNIKRVIKIHYNKYGTFQIKCNGKINSYCKNGVLKTEYMMKDGKLHNKRISYYANGKKRSEELFHYGRLKYSIEYDLKGEVISK